MIREMDGVLSSLDQRKKLKFSSAERTAGITFHLFSFIPIDTIHVKTTTFVILTSDLFYKKKKVVFLSFDDYQGVVSNCLDSLQMHPICRPLSHSDFVYNLLKVS